MPLTRAGDWAQDLSKSLDELFFMEYEPIEKIYPKIFKIGSTSKASESYSTLSGFGLVPEIHEGEAVAYSTPPGGNDLTLTPKEYAMGFRVTRNMWEDSEFNKIKELSKALGESMNHTVEYQTANLFNNGFGTSTFTCSDGKAFFTTDHPLKGGGTLSNEPSVAADLSESSLEAGLLNFSKLTNEQGIFIMKKPDTIMVPPELVSTAKILLQTQQRTGTSNNDINTLYGRGLTIVENPYLTDSDAWFLLCTGKSIMFLWREKPWTASDSDFDTSDLKFKAHCRYSFGVRDWRDGYASPGAA